MRRTPDAFEFIQLLAIKVISDVLKQAVLEADKQEKHPAMLAEKYPDAIDVEYRVIEDGRQESEYRVHRKKDQRT